MSLGRKKKPNITTNPNFPSLLPRGCRKTPCLVLLYFFTNVRFLVKRKRKREESRLISCRWKQTPELESGREVELLDLSSIHSPGESHSSGYSSSVAVELA